MRPKVSLLVAVRNESHYIEKCLESIFNQDYPQDRLEALVLDGNSTDDTWAIVEKMQETHPNLILLNNPRTTQAAGWNLGIEKSSGDILGIVSGHAELDPGYVSNAVETLERTGADLVGGPMRAVSLNYIGQAVAAATSTPFGVGGARFHYTEKEEVVDTVYMGLCWRRMYEQIGGFDEEMVRNQDDELSYRLLESGGQIVCNPKIKSRYSNRSTLRSLWKQYYQYGYWKVRVMQKHPRQMRTRQFIPALFVASLIASALLAPFTKVGRRMFPATAITYLLANWAATMRTGQSYGWRLTPLLPVVFSALHLSYGSGFLYGLIKFGRNWLKKGDE